MEAIQGVNLQELMNAEAEEIRQEQVRAARKMINGIYMDIARWKNDIRKAEQELAKKKEKLAKAENKLVELGKGNWNILQDKPEKEKEDTIN